MLELDDLVRSAAGASNSKKLGGRSHLADLTASPNERGASGDPQPKWVVVYDPDSALRSPGQLLSGMWSDLTTSGELAWRLAVRDFKAQYRESLLGVVWVLLLPVLSALVFIVLNKRGVIEAGDTVIPYAAYVLFSMLMWQSFVRSLSAPLRANEQGKAMLVAAKFPVEALVLSGLGLVMFEAVIKAVVVVAIFAAMGVGVTWWTLAAPLSFMLMLLLGTMVGLLITPIGMLYKDIERALIPGTTVLMFLTPVVYAPPEQGAFAWINTVNPVSPLLTGTMSLVTQGTIPNPLAFTIVGVVTVVGLVVGWVVYRLAIPLLIERMGN
jgi:lipopolysaccharide transport system permease protein